MIRKRVHLLDEKPSSPNTKETRSKTTPEKKVIDTTDKQIDSNSKGGDAVKITGGDGYAYGLGHDEKKVS